MKHIALNTEVLMVSGHYGERNDVSAPHRSAGFTVEKKAQIDVCPFYDFCLESLGFIGQVNCIKNNAIVCRNKAAVKNLGEDI